MISWSFAIPEKAGENVLAGPLGNYTINMEFLNSSKKVNYQTSRFNLFE